MATFQDLDTFFDDTLRLPIAGREYVVPAPSAELGLTVTRLVMNGGRIDDAAAEVLSDDEERDLYARILGPTYDEMIGDGVSWSKIQHCGRTAMIWIALGSDAAERAWLGKAMMDEPEPTNRAGRRARSTRSAGAAATPARGSMSGTKSTARRSAGSGRANSRTKIS